MSGDWIEGELQLPRALLEELQGHALETYPSECCGFVTGPAAQPKQLTKSQREVNEADKFHKLDPVTFPRTSREYFKINELRAARAFEAAEKAGEPVKVMMRLVVDRASDRVLGCHMVGEEAGEIIQGLAVALTAGATKAQFDETVGLHPSAAEEFVTMYQAST